MGISFKWDITHICNLNCAHCIKGNELGKIENELRLDEIDTLLNNLNQVEVDYIHLLGGEPTAREDFTEIIKLFDKHQINFGFNTNGLLMNSSSICSAIANSKSLTNVIFSLEGPNQELNDKIRGKKVFEVTRLNIKRLVKLCDEHNQKIKVTVNTVISKLNVDYISDMIEFCINLGVNEIVLLQMIVGGNLEDDDLVISGADELRLVEVIADAYEKHQDKINIVPRFLRPLAKDYSERVLLKNFPTPIHGCGAGTEFGYILNNGALYPCDRYRDQVDSKYGYDEINLRDNDFYNIWEKKEYGDLYQMTTGFDFYSQIEPCNQCKYLKKECFPCPPALLEINGNEYFKMCKEYMNRINSI